MTIWRDDNNDLREWPVWVGLAIFITLTVLLAGCASDDGPDPVDSCYELTREACIKLNECTGVTVRECEDAAATAVDCETTKEVNENFKRCLNNWKNGSCSTINDPVFEGYASCVDVFE